MAISNKLQSIRNIRAQMPAANEQIIAQKNAARDLQMRGMVAGAPATYKAASQIGAQTAAAKGQDLVTGYQQAAAADSRVRELELSQRGLEERAKIAGAQRGFAAQREDILDRIADLGEEVQSKITADRLQFSTDQTGQKYLNSRQLGEWAVLKAKTAEQYADYAQTVQQATQRQMQMSEVAHKKMLQVLENEHLWQQYGLDKQAALELKQLLADHEKALRDMENDHKNKQAMWQAGGTIVGAGLGALAGGPAGAAAGASIGGAAGTAIGGAL